MARSKGVREEGKRNLYMQRLPFHETIRIEEGEQYRGSPRRWIGSDRFGCSHPSSHRPPSSLFDRSFSLSLSFCSLTDRLCRTGEKTWKHRLFFWALPSIFDNRSSLATWEKVSRIWIPDRIPEVVCARAIRYWCRTLVFFTIRLVNWVSGYYRDYYDLSVILSSLERIHYFVHTDHEILDYIIRMHCIFRCCSLTKI